MNTLVGLLYAQDWGFNGWTLLLLVAEILSLLTLPSILRQRLGQPLSALSWFLAMVAFPFFGVLAWWLIGRSHLKRKRLRRRKASGEIRGSFAALRRQEVPVPPPCEDRRRSGLREYDGVFAMEEGNRVELLSEGKAAFDALESLILGAGHHIHLLFYTWQTDATGRRFRDLLARRAREGVKVRLLCDALGSFSAAGSFMRPLREAGAKVAFFSPARYLRRSLSINFRNHRKIIVADGCAAYTGGFNIGDEYAWKWEDAGLIVRGPAVAQLQEVFAEDWYYAAREALAEAHYVESACGDPTAAPGDPAACAVVAGGPDTESNITQDAFFIAITSARERIWITTPYLIPTAAIQVALRTAVRKGVDVRVMVPRTSDQRLTAIAGRSYYPTLLAGGVRVFEYVPAMLHAKVWVVDRDISVVGSANLDIRSFKLNFETSCFLHGAEVNGRLADLFEARLRHSEEVTAARLRGRGYWTELSEAALNLLSPLL